MIFGCCPKSPKITWKSWVCGKRMSLGMWEEFMEEQQLYIPVWKSKRAYFYLEQLN